MTITLGEGITIATLITSVVAFIIRSSENAKRSREDLTKLRTDFVGEVAKLRSEIEPVAALAQESLRQSHAAFKAIDELREEYKTQREMWARLDERVKTERYEREREALRWARATDRFPAPPDPGAAE